MSTAAVLERDRVHQTGAATTGHVKGSIFVKVVKSLRARREQAEPLIPQHLRSYLDCRVLGTEWFPEADYLELMKVVAQLVDSGEVEVWEFLGRDSARVDYEGLYRQFIVGKVPAAALRGVQIMWPLRHDTGTVTIDLQGPGKAAVHLRGYALKAPEVLRAIQGTIWQTLHMAGATDIRLRCHQRPGSGVTWSASWTDPPTG